MRLMNKSLIICFALIAVTATASISISIRGTVTQIKDGKAEIKNQTASSWVVLSKLPKESQEAIQLSKKNHKEIILNVAAEALARTKK